MLYGDVDIVSRFAFPGALEYTLRFLRDEAAALPDGRHEFPDGMYAEVKRYRPSPAAQRLFESHERYADVQCVLEGEEAIFVLPAMGLEAKENLLAEKDIIFYREPPDADGLRSMIMAPGKFLLLLPEDGHKPECLTRVAEGRKAIFKIPVPLLTVL